jgi:hypothetical protein
LTQTNDDTTSNEDTDVSTGRKCLHEGSDDDENGSSGHANAAPSKISQRTTQEETSYDSSDGVCSVDGANGVGIGMVEVLDPVLRSLDGVED